MEIDKFIGFLLPPAIDLINRRVADSDARFWISVLFCSVIGTGISFINFGGRPPLNDIINAIFVVFGTAQISYKAVYQDSKIQNSIRA
jgi:hypothetical protein